METNTESKEMITLYSSDGEEFKIEESVAKKFRTNSKKPKVINYSKKVITLRSSDGLRFDIEENEAVESQTLKDMFEVDCAESEMYLPLVNGEILSIMVEYLVKHSDSSSESDEKTADEELKAWDAELLKEVDEYMLHDLLEAAYDLGIDSLAYLAFKFIRRAVLMNSGGHHIHTPCSADD